MKADLSEESIENYIRKVNIKAIEDSTPSSGLIRKPFGTGVSQEILKDLLPELERRHLLAAHIVKHDPYLI